MAEPPPAKETAPRKRKRNYAELKAVMPEEWRLQIRRVDKAVCSCAHSLCSGVQFLIVAKYVRTPYMAGEGPCRRGRERASKTAYAGAYASAPRMPSESFNMAGVLDPGGRGKRRGEAGKKVSATAFAARRACYCHHPHRPTAAVVVAAAALIDSALYAIAATALCHVCPPPVHVRQQAPLSAGYPPAQRGLAGS